MSRHRAEITVEHDPDSEYPPVPEEPHPMDVVRTQILSSVAGELEG